VISNHDVMRALCKRDYAEYVEYVHDGRFIHGRFTRYVCAEVQAFIETPTDNAYSILILSVPPQHGKSMTITETLPSWYLGRYPMNRVIEVSYNETYAVKFSRRNHEKIVKYGFDLFGIQIGKPDTANEFFLANGVGSMQSRGVLSGVTGNPAELFIIDDPLKTAQEAYSKTTRESVFSEWTSSFKTRLGPDAKVILITTRWHKEDLAGMLIASEAHVKVINFPVECEEQVDVLGRTYGDPLCPEIGRTKAWVDDFKLSFTTKQGSRAWNSLYRGKPTDEEGGVFQRRWFKHYQTLPTIYFKCISVDATFKDGEEVDFVAIHVYGKSGPNVYGIERIKRRMGFVETITTLSALVHKHSDYKAMYIEDKANGPAIIDMLSRRYMCVIPVNPEGGKYARASAVSPMFEAGNVLIPDDWNDFEDELCDFPNSEHDDDVDACSQALNKLRDIVADALPLPDPNLDEDAMDSIDDVLNYH
jgi:predicted phage terminase large subunit-like protein